MLPGPVFNVELLTTARRARYYALRFFYGAVLLAVVWQNDPAHYTWYYGASHVEMTLQQAAALGDALFSAFAVTQSAAVLLLTPAFVAGVIAEEKQRKTLHYLLASRLTSAEIVLGKLAARLLHLGVFVAAGLPVLSLLTLFGGVAPELIVLTFAASLTTIFFLAALSILVSTYAKRPREAIGLVYVLELAWLFLPLLIAQLMPMGGAWWVRAYEWIRPVNNWVGASGPLYALITRGTLSFEPYAWMIGLQTGYGSLMVLLAVVRLRPVFRVQGDTSRLATRLASWKHGGRLLPRPECGDDPMLWKERYVSRTSVATKLVGGLVVLGLIGALAYSTYELAVPAFRELVQFGYGSLTNDSARDDLSRFIRILGALIYVAWALGVASAASGSIVHEREADTWISLLATPLDGESIVRAKMLGAVWGTRWIGALLLGLWTLGLAAGSVHPFGYVGAIVEAAVFIAFAAALGTAISLRAKNSGRAMTATAGLMVLLNGGYLLCCIPMRADTPLILFGVTPFLQGMTLGTYEEFGWLGGSVAGPWGHRTGEVVLACLLGTLAYGVAAVMLALASVGTFDEAVDRPRRFGQVPVGRPALKEALDAEGIEFLE